MSFQDRRRNDDNAEEEKANLLSVRVPFPFAWTVYVHASLYDKEAE